MRRSIRARIVVPLVLLLAGGVTPAAAEWVDWIADASLGFEFTDNINRAGVGRDEESDVVWRPAVALGRVYQLGARTRLGLSADVEGQIFTDFGQLDGARPGATVALVHKLGLGDAPWVRVHAFGGYLAVQESERSGRILEPGIEIGRRFSPRLDARLGYRYLDRDGGRGAVLVPTLPTDVFDQQRHALTAAGSVLVTPTLLLSASYAYEKGEHDSTCARDALGLLFAREGSNVRAIARDDVFGDCVYRSDRDAHAILVQLSWGLTRRTAVEVGYRFRVGEGRRITYESSSVLAALRFSY